MKGQLCDTQQFLVKEEINKNKIIEMLYSVTPLEIHVLIKHLHVCIFYIVLFNFGSLILHFSMIIFSTF